MNKIREDISKWSIEKRANKLSEIFAKKMGHQLNLKNPQAFSEMIQWTKLFYHDPNMTKGADKTTFKQYVAKELGTDKYTAKVYKVWENPADVDLKSVPKRCVVKSNCSSDGYNVLLVTDKEKIDIPSMEKEIRKTWFDKLSLHTNSFANYYYPVKPKVIVEEFLSDIVDCVDDYDVLCFNGEPRLIYVKTGHFVDGVNQAAYTVSFFDTDWNFIDVNYEGYKKSSAIERPPHFDEMMGVAKKLSANFPFVRVDFFENPKKLYLAEFSFSPWGGMRRYEPESFDYEMGKWLDIKNIVNPEYVDEYAKNM